MSVFAAEHARALALIRKKGADVTFTTVALSRNASTLVVTDGVSSTVPGAAIRVKGDPEEYEALGLTPREPVTLEFAADTFGDIVDLKSTVVWDGETKKVERVTPVSPDGPPIVSRVVVAS